MGRGLIGLGLIGRAQVYGERIRTITELEAYGRSAVSLSVGGAGWQPP